MQGDKDAFQEERMNSRPTWLPGVLRRAMLCAVLAALTIFAGATQPTSSSYDITGTMYNYDATGTPFTLQSDGSQSAVYSPSSTVSSFLYPNPSCRTTCGTTAYEWVLDLTQSSRYVLLTLIPVNGSAPFSGAITFRNLRSRCFDPSNQVFSWLAIQTSDSNCAMRVNFTSGGVDYSLVMSPIEPGTGTATLTCTNWNGSVCSAWTDVPSVGVANANVAHLYSAGKGGKTTLVGSYELTFKVTLTHP